MRLIKILPYAPLWPKEFAIEAPRIKNALGENCLFIHHIGSTSVPGLCAKPIIDILCVANNIMTVDKSTMAMQKLGYIALGEYGIPFRRFFQNGNESTHHVHIFEKCNLEIKRHLKFRDWMRLHQDDRNAYAKLKQELAKKYPNDITAYCLGKDAFINNIDSMIEFLNRDRTSQSQ
jgi:GrpB-like predicted nucleotidyltransferase (UPF0157 family)